MSELVSAYPTSGGHLLVGLQDRRPRGRLLHRLAEPDRPRRRDGRRGLRMRHLHRPHHQHVSSESYAGDYSLTRVFLIFVVVLVLAAVLNIFSSHLMAMMNNVSVWWHVAGAAAIVILILIVVPDQHQSIGYVFTERFNNSGFGGGSTAASSGSRSCPFGFLLTQYTITGFDASAHLSEETAERRRRWPPRASGARSSTPCSVATSCCSAWSSRSPTTRRDSRTTPSRWRRRRDLRARWAALATFVLLHLDGSAVLLRHLLHDLGLPDDLRVQPRRCDPRLEQAGRR